MTLTQKDVKVCLIPHSMANKQPTGSDESRQGLHGRLAVYAAQTTSFCFMRGQHLPYSMNVDAKEFEDINIESGTKPSGVKATLPHFANLSKLTKEELMALSEQQRMDIYNFCLNVLRILFCRGFYLYGNNIAQFFILQISDKFIDYRKYQERVQTSIETIAQLEKDLAKLKEDQKEGGEGIEQSGEGGGKGFDTAIKRIEKQLQKEYDNLESNKNAIPNPIPPPFTELQMQLYEPILTKQVQFIEQLVELKNLLALNIIFKDSIDTPVDVELFQVEGKQIQQERKDVDVSHLCKEIFELEDVDFIDLEGNKPQNNNQEGINYTRRFFFNETQLSNEQLLIQYMRVLYLKKHENDKKEELEDPLYKMAQMEMSEKEREPVWILLARLILEHDGVKNMQCIPDWLNDYVKYGGNTPLPKLFLQILSTGSQEIALKQLRIILGLYPESKFKFNEEWNYEDDCYRFERSIIDVVKKLPVWLENKIFQFFFCLMQIRRVDLENDKKYLSQKNEILGNSMQFNDTKAILLFTGDTSVQMMRKLAYIL